jgi:antitoxin component of RelBE/YafQ-DinJ toxin-antitoxin module
MSKNITLSVDEDVLQRARVVAASRRTSVSELVRGFLKSLTETAEQPVERDEAREALLKLIDESEGRMGDWRPSRAETYSGHPRFDM